MRGKINHCKPHSMDAKEARQQAAVHFTAYYERLCAQQNTCPMSSIRAAASEGQLNCQIYRLGKTDWQPILAALRVNKALHTLVFYDKWKEEAFLQLKGKPRKDNVQNTHARHAYYYTFTLYKFMV